MLGFFPLPRSCSYFLTFCLGILSSGLKNDPPLLLEGGSRGPQWGGCGQGVLPGAWIPGGCALDSQESPPQRLQHTVPAQEGSICSLEGHPAGEAGLPVEVQSMGLCFLKGQPAQSPWSNY